MGETQHVTAASISRRISMKKSESSLTITLREKASYIDASFRSIESSDGRPPSFIILLLLPPAGFRPQSMSMPANARRRPMHDTAPPVILSLQLGSV